MIFKAVTAYHRDRFILIIALFIPDRSLTSITHQPLKRSEFEAAHCRRRFAILSCTATVLKAELGAAHSRKKRSQHITVTALYCLLLCVTPPFRHLSNNSSVFKGGIWSGSQPQALSRCRLPQRKYQRIAGPMRKHRHNAPLYCPYIRLQESCLPSFRRLYRRQ